MSMDDFRIVGNTLVKYTGTDPHVVVPDGVRIIGGQAFGYNSNLISVVLPEGIVTIGERAFDSCQNLESVKIPSTVALIEKNAFVSCRALDNVVIPDGVPFLAAKTFYGCRSLKNVVIPETVTAIGDEAFKRCTALEAFAISDEVTEIGQEAFADCLSLKVVSVGSGVGVIHWNTFSGCRSLEKVGLCEGLREVEYGAFDNCSAITDLYFYGGEEAWRSVNVKSTRNETLVKATAHFDYKKPLTTVGKAVTKKQKIESEVESVLQLSFDILDEVPVTKKEEPVEEVQVEEPITVTEDVAQVEIDLEIPAVETPAEEATVEEASIEEAPAEEAPVEEAPIEEVVAETEDKPAEDVPAPAEVTPAPEASTEEAPKSPLGRRSGIRTTPKAAVSDVTEEFKKEFYETYISLIPLDVAATQQARAEGMTEEVFETLSEALFLVPAEEAYDFGCLCLYMGKYNRAFRAFLAAAGKGNLPSQYYVGGCFLYGIDTTKKIVDAARWLTKCKNDPIFGNDARRMLAIVDAELEKPENAGLKVKRGNK